MGIVDEIINYRCVSRTEATHFVIYRKNKIKYLIDLSDTKRRITCTLKSYTIKHNILSLCLKYCPFFLLDKLKLGDFVHVNLYNVLYEYMLEKMHMTSNDKMGYNILIGTYDCKQKIVIQAYDKSNYKRELYFKIGNGNTFKEMNTEIKFLQKYSNIKQFKAPILVDSQEFNSEYIVQVTKGFEGKKVNKNINKEIIELSKQVSNLYETKFYGNMRYTFSHGDFTPWNLRKMEGQYLIFDWEHSRYRFEGYDIFHFVYMVDTLLNKKSKKVAYKNAAEVYFEIYGNKKLSKDKLISMYIEEVQKTY